ncbi:Phage-related lysozyme (muramidase), GH24 family [Cribrihabitans marinus]|uniref:Lysozyme n=1 Tax=Cribrihabitans marinus TaxID=1227549 RepID=A0A1H7CRP1_9RHOB|nr:lysozyme [Cribrihabitans marinus]GGH36413.1 hypothetical protein GCM10010973_30320 [Cribrihabitans marinus]SEJ91874.1 Phage-related lysozyme (muramidase), GH24 family [Cribrihabitans marinus]
MRLVSNARTVAWRAYSMWCNYLGILCLVAPELIYWIWLVDTNPRIWWIGGLALILAGIVLRLIDQGIARAPAAVTLLAALLAGMLVSPAARAGPPSEAAFLEVATPLVAQWEGKRNKAYLDRIASPPVWTICFGETRGVKPGDYRTDAECLQMLRAGLIEYRSGLHRYFTEETLAARLTAARDAAYTSLSWNAGIRAIGRSTAVRRLNAGRIAGGCQALTWWNKAGGRVIRGLVNRRADEYRLCMQGVA